MNFRDLMTKLDNINNNMLAESLTLSAIIAVTSGYEQDDKVRIPKLAELAKENGLEGLVDPVTGNYISNAGEVDNEVPFEIAQKLSAAGLLPKNARLPQAGWFDNEDTFKKANADLVNQSSQISGDADSLHEKIKQMMDLFNKILELRKKRADKNVAATSLGSPGANAAAANAITPPNVANTLNNMQTGIKDASAGISNAVSNAITPAMQNTAGLKESLMTSFGYEQLNEDLAGDAGDAFRGAMNGATWGVSDNIAAAGKSLIKGTKYKDELAGELAAEKAAQERSPWLYGAGQVAGSFAAPGMGAAKGLKGVAGLMGKQYVAGQALDAVNAHTLGTDQTPVGPHPAGNTGVSKLAQLQQLIGTKSDGIMGPKTQAALVAWQQKNGLPATGKPDVATLAKAGLKEGTEMKQLTVAESIAAMRDKLERINNPQLDEANPLGTLATTLYRSSPEIEKAAQSALGHGNPFAAMSAAEPTVGRLANDAAHSFAPGAAKGAEKAAAGAEQSAAKGAANDATYAQGAANDATYAQGGMNVDALGKSKNYKFAGAAEKEAAKGNKKGIAGAALAGGALGYGLSQMGGGGGGGHQPSPGPHPGPKPHPHAQGNPEIMKWQELLNANGEHLKVDGIYGPATQAAYDRVFPKFTPDPKFPGTNAAPVSESIRTLSRKLSLIESGLDPAFMDQLANEGLADIAKGAWNAGKNLIGGAAGKGIASRVGELGPMNVTAADKLAHGAGNIINKNPKTAAFGAGGLAGYLGGKAFGGDDAPPVTPPIGHKPHVGGGGGHHATGNIPEPKPPVTPPTTPTADPADAEIAAALTQLKALMADVAKSSNPEAQKAVADMSTRLNGVQ
jgi:hypothetical protein